MVLTIAPRSEGSTCATSRDRAANLLPFAVGAALSGAAVFGASSVVGDLLLSGGGAARKAGIAVVASLAIAYGGSYLIGRPLPLPQTYRQVPKLWREVFSPKVAGLLYGVGLGFGFFTRIPYATLYFATALCLIAANPPLGLLAGAVFGGARALPLLFLRRHGASSDDLDVALDSFASRAHVRGVNGALLASAGVVLLVAVPPL